MTESRRCDVWASLFDARAAGEPLDDARLAFMERHEGSCERCAGEARGWARVATGVARASVDAASARRVAEAALARFEATRFALPRDRRRSPWPFVAAGTGFAAAAIALLFVRAPFRTPRSPTQAAPAPVVPATAAASPPLEPRPTIVDDVPVAAAQTTVESAGARFAIRPDHRPASAPPVTHRAAAPAHRPSASDRLAEARALRAAGRYAESAAIYRAVIAELPATVDGRMAMVLLGELELAHLGRPEEALALFDRYLASGDGALAEEAAYGRVKALRARGDRAGEARAIRALLAGPSERWRNALESRLRELER